MLETASGLARTNGTCLPNPSFHGFLREARNQPQQSITPRKTLEIGAPSPVVKHLPACH